MVWAYLVLLAIAALGLALGWRMTPVPTKPATSNGLARLLQVGIGLTGLAVLALLALPWFTSIANIACGPEDERTGHCVMGLRDHGLFGAAAFVFALGAAFAYVLRSSVFDQPPRKDLDDSAREAGVGDVDTVVRQDGKDVPTRPEYIAPEPNPRANVNPPGEREASPHGREDNPPGVEPEPSKPEPAADEPLTAAVAAEPVAAEPAAAEPAAAQSDEHPGGHRHLEGPVFRAFVDDQVVEIDAAIKIAAERLRSERVAVVFSRGASEDANEALLELAQAFDASRYVLEGTAAATEGVPTGQKPDPHAADEIAGPQARHAGELALHLAGGFVQTVFLLDTRVKFPEFVLGKLTELQSVCIAHAHDEVSAACQVVLPGTNPGEREGELIDDSGGANSRRPRAMLVKQIVAALRELDPGAREPRATEPSPTDS